MVQLLAILPVNTKARSFEPGRGVCWESQVSSEPSGSGNDPCVPELGGLSVSPRTLLWGCLGGRFLAHVQTS